jgi:hypothetical protein
MIKEIILGAGSHYPVGNCLRSLSYLIFVYTVSNFCNINLDIL